ncbi:ARHG7 factor, partial [Atractosteus spatula]|nr:ARHG7 factor [Atractosteus spatula]
MGCCSFTARHTGTDTVGPDEIELLEPGNAIFRVWSLAETREPVSESVRAEPHCGPPQRYQQVSALSRGSQRQDNSAAPRKLNLVVLWGRTREDLHCKIYTEPIVAWEGPAVHSYGEIAWSSRVLLFNHYTQERDERYLVLFSFHLLILQLDHAKKEFIYQRRLLRARDLGQESPGSGVQLAELFSAVSKVATPAAWHLRNSPGRHWPGVLPLSGMSVREIRQDNDVSNMFEIHGPMVDSKIVICANHTELKNWIKHIEESMQKVLNQQLSPFQSVLSCLVPCDEKWKREELKRYLLRAPIWQWEGTPIQHLGQIGYLSVVYVTNAQREGSQERILVLFPQDLLLLSIDSQRVHVKYEASPVLNTASAQARARARCCTWRGPKMAAPRARRRESDPVVSDLPLGPVCFLHDFAHSQALPGARGGIPSSPPLSRDAHRATGDPACSCTSVEAAALCVARRPAGELVRCGSLFPSSPTRKTGSWTVQYEMRQDPGSGSEGGCSFWLRGSAAWQGRLPLKSIRALEKSALLGRLEFEISGKSMPQPDLACFRLDFMQKQRASTYSIQQIRETSESAIGKDQLFKGQDQRASLCRRSSALLPPAAQVLHMPAVSPEHLLDTQGGMSKGTVSASESPCFTTTCLQREGAAPDRAPDPPLAPERRRGQRGPGSRRANPDKSKPVWAGPGPAGHEQHIAGQQGLPHGRAGSWAPRGKQTGRWPQLPAPAGGHSGRCPPEAITLRSGASGLLGWKHGGEERGGGDTVRPAGV